MEYTNGVMEMFRIADEWGRDRTRPTSELVPGHGTYPGPVDVVFETSEPATVYYTTDGSRPTLDSPRYKATEFREPGGDVPCDRDDDLPMVLGRHGGECRARLRPRETRHAREVPEGDDHDPRHVDAAAERRYSTGRARPSSMRVRARPAGSTTWSPRCSGRFSSAHNSGATISTGVGWSSRFSCRASSSSLRAPGWLGSKAYATC
jgi:Chitobiase/beta-hexosaminidase C-terminal domain